MRHPKAIYIAPGSNRRFGMSHMRSCLSFGGNIFARLESEAGDVKARSFLEPEQGLPTIRKVESFAASIRARAGDKVLGLLPSYAFRLAAYHAVHCTRNIRKDSGIADGYGRTNIPPTIKAALSRLARQAGPEPG